MATFVLLTVLCSLRVLSALSANLGVNTCQQGEFWNDVMTSCEQCSTCQINHIVRRPCTPQSDTECGPFYEFDFLKLSGLVEEPEAKNDNRESDGGVAASDGNSASSRRHHDNEWSKGGIVPTKGPASRGDDTRWRELCFGLIGAIAAVTLFALAYVIITQIRGNKTHCKDCKAAASYAHQDAQPLASYYHSRVSPRGDVMLVHPDVLHLETQLQQNHARRSLFQRLLRPGRLLSGGNDYVDDVTNHPGLRRPILLQAIQEQEMGDASSGLSDSPLLSPSGHVVPSLGHVVSETSLYRSRDDPQFSHVHNQNFAPDRASL